MSRIIITEDTKSGYDLIKQMVECTCEVECAFKNDVEVYSTGYGSIDGTSGGNDRFAVAVKMLIRDKKIKDGDRVIFVYDNVSDNKEGVRLLSKNLRKSRKRIRKVFESSNTAGISDTCFEKLVLSYKYWREVLGLDRTTRPLPKTSNRSITDIDRIKGIYTTSLSSNVNSYWVKGEVNKLTGKRNNIEQAYNTLLNLIMGMAIVSDLEIRKLNMGSCWTDGCKIYNKKNIICKTCEAQGICRLAASHAINKRIVHLRDNSDFRLFI